MRYTLKPGLHFCICSGRAVFLDVPGDRYFCLPGAIDEDFQLWVAGQGDDDRLSLTKLIELGVLIEAPPMPRIARPQLVEAPQSDLSTETSRNLIWILWVSAEHLVAKLRVRRSSFATLIQALENEQRIPKVPPTDSLFPSKLAGAFSRSRLLVHGWDDCLAQSIAFRRACRRLRIDAQIVIGVCLDPFAAHCWVQLGDIVLNDNVERVRHFTPILAA